MKLTALVHTALAVFTIALAASGSNLPDMETATRDAIAPVPEYAAFEQALRSANSR